MCPRKGQPSQSAALAHPWTLSIVARGSSVANAPQSYLRPKSLVCAGECGVLEKSDANPLGDSLLPSANLTSGGIDSAIPLL